MPRRATKDSATELAEKMVQVLQAQRPLGDASYPLPLRRLAELADPTASPELVRQAIAKKKPFGERVIVLQPRNLDSPAALTEDAERLAQSPAALMFALEVLCSPSKPTCEVGKLKGKLPARLKPAFEAAVRQRLAENQLPPGVAVVEIRKKKHLHLVRYELPRPPEVHLAQNLVRVLQAQRALGGTSYPLTLARLVDLTQPEAASALVKKALNQAAFHDAVLQAAKGKPEAPVVLAGDCDVLLASDLLLETVLRWERKPANHICTPAALKKKVVATLQQPLEDVLQRRIADRQLPPTVGCLLQRNKPVLFLLSDVQTAAITRPISTPRVEPPAPPVRAEAPPVQPVPDFARAFDEAFEQIDRRKGSHNFVSLAELRRALPVDRPTFDAELMRLRQAGRYILSAAEGRHGIGAEEQAAGITEFGSLLLYVSRKLS